MSGLCGYDLSTLCTWTISSHQARSTPSKATEATLRRFSAAKYPFKAQKLLKTKDISILLFLKTLVFPQCCQSFCVTEDVAHYAEMGQTPCPLHPPDCLNPLENGSQQSDVSPVCIPGMTGGLGVRGSQPCIRGGWVDTRYGDITLYRGECSVWQNGVKRMTFIWFFLIHSSLSSSMISSLALNFNFVPGKVSSFDVLKIFWHRTSVKQTCSWN